MYLFGNKKGRKMRSLKCDNVGESGECGEMENSSFEKVMWDVRKKRKATSGRYAHNTRLPRYEDNFETYQ